MLDRIDLNRLLERVDLTEIVKRIDVDALSRRPTSVPLSPDPPAASRAMCSMLSAARPSASTSSGRPVVIRESLQGKYAGFASRFAAFAADVAVTIGVFTLALAAISFAARVLW